MKNKEEFAKTVQEVEAIVGDICLYVTAFTVAGLAGVLLI